jgi:alkylhydroperoxidase family enzyme
MSYIEMVDEKEAEGLLEEIYHKLGGRVANILKASSLFPESLDAHLQLYKTLMFKKSPLSRAEREMIATTVSSVNECHY